MFTTYITLKKMYDNLLENKFINKVYKFLSHLFKSSR